MPRHLNFLDEIGEIKSLSHLVSVFKAVSFEKEKDRFIRSG